MRIQLTPQELKAIELKMEGLTNEQVAVALGISRSTIQRMFKKSHIRAYLAELKQGLANVTQVSIIREFEELRSEIVKIVLSQDADTRDADKINAFKTLCQVAGLTKSTLEVGKSREEEALRHWLKDEAKEESERPVKDWSEPSLEFF